MKTIKQVKQDNPERTKLINAVLRNIDKENIEDVNRHGINAGFGKFIYYKDTIEFYRKNRKEINKLVFDTAEMLGEEPVKMIQNFNCIRDEKNEYRNEIEQCIYGGNIKDQVTIPNALSWFAAEEVCRMFED